MPQTTKGIRYPDSTTTWGIIQVLQDLATDADTAIGDWAVENLGGVESFERGTRNNQPAAGTAGRFYYVEDKNVLEVDDGTAWRQIVELPDGNNVDDTLVWGGSNWNVKDRRNLAAALDGGNTDDLLGKDSSGNVKIITGDAYEVRRVLDLGSQYGATGGDDTQAIKDALTDAVAGDAIRFLDVHTISDTIDWKSGVHIIPDLRGTTVSMADGVDLRGFLFSGVSDVAVFGPGKFVIDMNKANTTDGGSATGQQALYVLADGVVSENLDLRHIEVRNGHQRGIHMQAINGGTLKSFWLYRPYAHDFGDAGIYIHTCSDFELNEPVTNDNGSAGLSTIECSDYTITNPEAHRNVHNGVSMSKNNTDWSIAGVARCHDGSRIGLAVGEGSTDWSIDSVHALGNANSGCSIDLAVDGSDAAQPARGVIGAVYADNNGDHGYYQQKTESVSVGVIFASNNTKSGALINGREFSCGSLVTIDNTNSGINFQEPAGQAYGDHSIGAFVASGNGGGDTSGIDGVTDPILIPPFRKASEPIEIGPDGLLNRQGVTDEVWVYVSFNGSRRVASFSDSAFNVAVAAGIARVPWTTVKISLVWTPKTDDAGDVLWAVRAEANSVGSTLGDTTEVGRQEVAVDTQAREVIKTEIGTRGPLAASSFGIDVQRRVVDETSTYPAEAALLGVLLEDGS